MKQLHVFLGAGLLILLSSLCSTADIEDYSATIDVFEQSPQTQPYFENAYGYAVFPTVGKGGLGRRIDHGPCPDPPPPARSP